MRVLRTERRMGLLMQMEMEFRTRRRTQAKQRMMLQKLLLTVLRILLRNKLSV